MTPSRRSTPTANASDAESAAQSTVPRPNDGRTAAVARMVLGVLTGAEYTPGSGRGALAEEAVMAVVARAELKAIVERFAETWQRRDPAAWPSITRRTGSPRARCTRRCADARRSKTRTAPSSPRSPTPRIIVENIVVDPPYVVMFTTCNATHQNDFFGLPGTNRHVEFRMSRLMKMNDDGLIEHERRIYDFTGLLVQIGVLRAKPAKP